ncbi:hypothetical protein VTL71DRAFT_11642 [Oculimacula yallundae]|uniref:RING-14 protein n=1 Tax=Oculimacula yallundae TaxID=86028 RepID=A0ABR4CR27_9HELO
MKFGREFKQVLEKEGFPPEWVDTAIPYRTLKKLLKKIQAELEGLGFDSTTLAQLHQSSPDEEGPNGDGVAFQYKFEGSDKFVPKLSFFINVDDGTPEDAALSPETRRYFEAQALKQHGNSAVGSFGSDGQSDIPKLEGSALTEKSKNLRRIDVHLRFDAEFFGLLQGDVNSLETLQAQEQKMLTTEILALSKSLAVVARPNPSAVHKSDLNRWRQLFDLYLQAGVFFSTHELDHGSRSSAKAAQQLQWFQSEVIKRDIVSRFKMKDSHVALTRFVKINIDILQNLKFQELQRTAISKILKKFDKRTKLGAARSFPKLISSDSVMGSSMAKSVCAQISQELVQIVPQVEDHACPICCDICWRPVRLKCKHLVCIRCTILLQRERKRFCPMCRDDVVMQADTDNIDRDLEDFLKKYFPKETNKKQIDNETADGIENFGPAYRHPSEHSCAIM